MFIWVCVNLNYTILKYNIKEFVFKSVEIYLTLLWSFVKSINTV